MKKILFTIFILAGFIQLNQAQEIGIRFGDAIGGKYAVDGVIGLAGFSRIHAMFRSETVLEWRPYGISFINQ